MNQQEIDYFEGIHFNDGDTAFLPLSERGSDKPANCWVCAKAGFIELSQSQFIGFANGDVEIIEHEEGKNMGWKYTKLRLVILHTRNVSVIPYNQAGKERKLVSRDFIRGGKKRLVIYALSPDLVDDDGNYLPFTFSISGKQASIFETIAGGEFGISKSKFFNEVINPLTLAIDPRGKTMPLNREYFHIPITFDSGKLKVESTEEEGKASQIYPLKGDWNPVDVANAIKEISIGLTPIPSGNKEAISTAINTRKNELFARIRKNAILARFFGASKNEDGVLQFGYMNLVKSFAPNLETYKEGLVAFDNYQLSNPRYQLALFCNENGLRNTVKPLDIYDKHNGNLAAAEKEVMDLVATQQANAPRKALADFTGGNYERHQLAQ